MPLTEVAIKGAKPREKPYKMKDGRGLYLRVSPSGSKLWRLRYRAGGRENMLSLGPYPDVSLKDARDRRDEARRLLAQGQDPAAVKRAERRGVGNTFAKLAEEWLEKRSKRYAPATLRKAQWVVLDLIVPELGERPVTAITPEQVLTFLQKLERAELYETAHRAKQRIGQILRYARATGRGGHDVTADLRGALQPSVHEHHGAILEPARVGELLRAMDGYSGQPSTVYALRLLPYLFTRPGELRRARWAWMDLQAAEYRIPASIMKMGEQHIVPLSRQAIALLETLYPITGAGELVFPSVRTRERPISDNTLNAALRRLGYTHEEQVAHGFRRIASTFLNELGFPGDVIELQLAHQERNKVRGIYNGAQHMQWRRVMMQIWADYLDALKAGDAAAAATGARLAIQSSIALTFQPTAR